MCVWPLALEMARYYLGRSVPESQYSGSVFIPFRAVEVGV